MTWQAIHLVVEHGPDDDKLFRLCVAVARATTTVDGRKGRIGQRLLAERCRVSPKRLRQLVDAAVEGEWIAVDHVGDGSGPTVYSLGPLLKARARLSGEGARGLEDLASKSRASLASNDAQPVPTSRAIERDSAPRKKKNYKITETGPPSNGGPFPVGNKGDVPPARQNEQACDDAAPDYAGHAARLRAIRAEQKR